MQPKSPLQTGTGLAQFYVPLALGEMAHGTQLLSAVSVERASREEFHGKDVIAGMPVRRSLGFMLADPEHSDPRPSSAFGHPGMGGSIGFADPARRLATGYVMNWMVFALCQLMPGGLYVSQPTLSTSCM